LLDPCLPKAVEHASFNPFLKAIMRSGASTQLSRIQRFPLATGAQHKKDGIGTAAVSYARSASSEAMRIGMLWQAR